MLFFFFRLAKEHCMCNNILKIRNTLFANSKPSQKPRQVRGMMKVTMIVTYEYRNGNPLDFLVKFVPFAETRLILPEKTIYY